MDKFYKNFYAVIWHGNGWRTVKIDAENICDARKKALCLKGFGDGDYVAQVPADYAPPEHGPIDQRMAINCCTLRERGFDLYWIRYGDSERIYL